MLNKIPWSSFFWTLLLILVVYYLYVFIVYFRKELFSFGSINKTFFRENSRQKIPLNNGDCEVNKPFEISDKSDDNSFIIVHELLEELKDLFLNASKTSMVKEELIQAIRTKLKANPILGKSDLVDDINMHIVQETKDKCDTELFPEDLKLIWSH